MPEGYEHTTNDPDEAMFAFAVQLNVAAMYVLEDAFRSVTIEGDVIALFMERRPDALAKIIHRSLDLCAEPDNDKSARLTVAATIEDDALTITSLPIEAVADPSLN